MDRWAVKIDRGFEDYSGLPLTMWMKVFESYDSAKLAFEGMRPKNAGVYANGDNLTAIYKAMGAVYFLRLERWRKS